MASLNKDYSQKDILDDGINILAVKVKQNDVLPYMSELTNATIMDLTQMSEGSTNDQYTDNEDERIALIIL